MEYKKLIDNVLSESGLKELPTELQTENIHLWEGDINSEKDWDDWTGGQLVNHMYYKKSFKAGIDVLNLEYGNNAQSFYGLLNRNETIEIYSSEYIDLTGKFITIGDDLKTFYLAVSHSLSNFSLKQDKETKTFLTKIVLVNLVKYLSNEFDDGDQAPTINVEIGKVNETIKVPKLKHQDNFGMYDPELAEFEIVKIHNEVPDTIEIFLPDPAIFKGVDIIKNESDNQSPLHDKRVEPKSASTKPEHFPINPHYSILPAQFNIASIDNYGFTHPADSSNQIKVLNSMGALGTMSSASGSIGSATGSTLAKTGGIVSSITTGLAQRFFGDKGALANSLAITPKVISGSGDAIKFFIQPDGTNETHNQVMNGGILNLEKLNNQHDYIETNQAKGEFGKVGKSMSPSNNAGFDTKKYYRGLGLGTLHKLGTIPALSAPYSKVNNLKINDDKIDKWLKWGVPRLKIHTKDHIAPAMFPETWEVYIRNMFFRPDPYSFWNWPLLAPSEIGVYDTHKQTSIAYDNATALNNLTSDICNSENVLKEAIHGIGKLASGIENVAGVMCEASGGAGTDRAVDNTDKMSDGYWNKTITLNQLEQNNLYDPNKTFSSLQFKFNRQDLQNLYQLHLDAFTTSIVEVKLIKDGKVLRSHKFNSQGKNVGTSASSMTIVQF